MVSQVSELMSTVVDNDYCIGCGICASFKNSPISMRIDENGKYIPYIKPEELNELSDPVIDVCPFSENNNVEDVIGQEVFGQQLDITYDKYSGYHLQAFAGYVLEEPYRKKGSSGGMGNWIAAKLLENNLVDGIIHVKPTEDPLFKYDVSNDVNELLKGSKSKYYPIELSEVLNFVRNNKGRYAIIGIPCYIKGVRLLEKQDNILNERVKYHIGLVCGHLKSEMFAKSIGWQLDVKPQSLKAIDFRKKLPDRPANHYGVEVMGDVEGKESKVSSPTRDLYTTNWGYGFFKYNACEFCDDILAETADITVGDAWLPEYSQDSLGTNVIVVRNSELKSLLEQYNGESIHLEKISSDKVYDSQAGGFRHRRDGLSYRLYLKDKENKWRPKKRVEPNNNLSRKRKLTYEHRSKLSMESFRGYRYAIEQGEFKYFIQYMEPFIKEYKKVIKPSLPKRAASKILREIRRIIK